MTLHHEIEFENDICNHLSAHGWLYAEGDATHYDRARALFPADLTAWVQASQPHAWEQLQKNHGAAAETLLLDRLRKQLDDRGTLNILRFGIDLVGLRQTLQLAQFKPALAMNPDLQTRYAANRLRVIRQVRYSLHNENAIDLVLFLNGIPVATVELNPCASQAELSAALVPIADRLLKSFATAKRRSLTAKEKNDAGAITDAQQEMASLQLVNLSSLKRKSFRGWSPTTRFTFHRACVGMVSSVLYALHVHFPVFPGCRVSIRLCMCPCQQYKQNDLTKSGSRLDSPLKKGECAR